ncbi:hypothetical protein [Actinocorallia libanotica]|uniref:Uncharacterized protein n=1 Tax=Actinocorallia libanotica TaxID=46162 RepID=A0ABN1RPT6_9ACTN
MSARTLRRAGAVLLAGGAATVLIAYLAGAGLDRADKIASVCGLFIGLCGLGLALYGLVAARRSGDAAPVRTVHNEVHPGSAPSTIIQGDHFGTVNLGVPPSAPEDGST